MSTHQQGAQHATAARKKQKKSTIGTVGNQTR